MVAASMKPGKICDLNESIYKVVSYWGSIYYSKLIAERRNRLIGFRTAEGRRPQYGAH